MPHSPTGRDNVSELARNEEATVAWLQGYGTLTREEAMVGAIIGLAEAQVLRSPNYPSSSSKTGIEAKRCDRFGCVLDGRAAIFFAFDADAR